MQNKSVQQKHHIHSLHQCFVHHDLSQNINLFLQKNFTISLRLVACSRYSPIRNPFFTQQSPRLHQTNIHRPTMTLHVFFHTYIILQHIKMKLAIKAKGKHKHTTTIRLQFLNKLKIKTVTFC